MRPGGTEGWAPGSLRGVWGPRRSTSAAVGAGWPGGGPGLLRLLLLPVGAVGAGLGWRQGGWAAPHAEADHLVGLGPWAWQKAGGAVGEGAR